MQPTGSRTNRNVLVVVALLLLGFGGIGAICVASAVAVGVGAAAAFAGLPGVTLDDIPLRELDRISVERTVAETFDVGDGGRLVVDLDFGEVKVVATDGSAVVVDGHIYAFGSDATEAQSDLDRIRLSVTRDGDAVRIEGEADEPARGWHIRSPRVVLTLSVPRRTSVALNVDVGDIRIDGTSSDADIEVAVGRVVVRDVAVARRLVVRTEVAAIEFDGDLVGGANYEFRSQIGAITLRLPRESRFGLDARTQLGAVDVDFDVRGEQALTPLHRSVRGDINGGGDTEVTAASSLGAIAVHRR